MRQREHLATRRCATDQAIEAYRRVDQGFQTEALRQRRDEQQPGVRDQVRVIKDRVDPVDGLRYSRH